MTISQYDRLEEDRQWMNDYGCIRIVEESDENERNRPLSKQLMVAFQRATNWSFPSFPTPCVAVVNWQRFWNFAESRSSV